MFVTLAQEPENTAISCGTRPDKTSSRLVYTAVVIDSSYVKEFNLSDLYAEVIIDDAINLIKDPRIRYDLVIIGDCIEHMRKSDGLDLLNFLIYRSGYICVVYSAEYGQDDCEGHAAEAHIHMGT